MGFFMSQGMKVKLMVCKDSKQNEQEILGNKNFYKQCKNQQLFQQERLLFLFKFSKISCSKHKGISLKSVSYLYSKFNAKTYAKKTSS